MAANNGTILHLLTNAPSRAHACLHAFPIQNQEFTAENAESAEEVYPNFSEFSSAISACSAVKRFLSGIRGDSVFLPTPSAVAKAMAGQALHAGPHRAVHRTYRTVVG